MVELNRERKFIFYTVLVLTLFGLLMVYEASSLYAYKLSGDPMYFFKKQFIFFLVSLLLFFLTLIVDIEFLKKYNKEFLLFNIILLLLVLLIGKRAGGARRWLNFGGFNLQPSEMLKVFFLIYCAYYVSTKGKLIRNFRRLLPLGIVLGCVCVLIVLEPDLGTAIFWVLWLFLFILLHNAKAKHLILLLTILIVASTPLTVFHPYRFRRLTAYLNPFSDPQDSGFQLIQAQICFGVGGLSGVGFGEGKQKLFFLPAAHTDFIFSVIAEELGIIGSLGLLFIFFIIFSKLCRIANSISEPWRKSILWGIILIFSLEVVINIGVSCGLFPTKGLPLPFISCGGSNLITHYILLGLFFNASRYEDTLSL